jgi:hypothetical protein
MHFRGKKLEALTTSDIQQLLENKVSESRTLDYKREIKFDERGKVDLLCDITAFYNTEGGFMVVGLEEEKDVTGKNTGVPQLSETKVKVSNYDQLRLNIQNLLRDTTNPVITNISFSPLINLDGHDIFIIGIPVTESLPAMVKYSSMSRFYKRNSNGNYLLDTYELSQLFTKAAQLEKQVAEFIQLRRFNIFVDDIFPSKGLVQAMLLHIVPITHFQEPMDSFSNKDFLNIARTVVESPDDYGHGARYFFDGIQADGDDRNRRAYGLLFRDGSLELFTNSPFYPQKEGQPAILSIARLLKSLSSQLNRTLNFYQEQSIEPPYMLSLSFNNVKDFSISLSEHDHHKVRYPREVFTLPHIKINLDRTELDEQIKGLIDILFQSFNFRECPQDFFDIHFKYA